MVVEAFTDLVFTPDNNHRHEPLLGLSSGENGTTQPTDTNFLSPRPREIGPTSFLHSPRYLLASPNATFEPIITSPTARPSPNAALFPLQSPLPPLTPLADFVSPQGWGMMSPHGSLNPSFLLDTPNSISRDQESDELPLAAPSTLNENETNKKKTEQSDNPSTAQIRNPEMSNREDKKEADGNGHHFSFSRDDDVLRLPGNPPDVRRRLFDEGIDKSPLATTNSERQLHKALKPVLAESQPVRKSRMGLKSRITPPPPMLIPTNPISNCRIQEIREKQGFRATTKSLLDRGTSSRPQASSLHISQDELHMKMQTDVPQNAANIVRLPTVANYGASSRHTRGEEERPVMTSEASSVLAELKRQRTQVEEGRENASSFNLSKSLKVSGPNERTCCNCKVSQCIKRYCPCFATSNFCGPDCGCRNCENTLNNSSCVGIARKALMERDPNAFVPRIRSSQRQKARGRQTIRGCNCRKGCGKNYCICRENGLVCGVRCTCSGPSGCQNQDQSKLSDIQQVIENMPPPNHFDTVARDSRGLESHLAGRSKKAERQDLNNVQVKAENLAQQASSLHIADPPKSSANDVFVDYPALPTPTTPSMPYIPFFGNDRSNKKRSMTFGEISGGFKRIRVANSKESSLAELRQSPPKTVAEPYSKLHTSIETNRSLEMPPMSTLPSSDSPASYERNMLDCSSILPNGVDGNDHLTMRQNKSQHIPRILRYKFGSGKSAGPLEYPR